ncbi:MAG: PAS domain S-box protein [Rhodoferax sp.]|uniref:PAS domain S-box protein n=1 Tax=Rhodoferax sp. TaxID=50421 RepID=UPI00263184FD|nr:PAS domain S-box protein [Rhodoferax sp.]MDD5332843.1 PAS domain S-box protein [Rhodoferax sp.]
MNHLRTWFATAWQRLIAVQARDEEEARLGRLFNTMMVISLGIVVSLSIDFLLLQPLGLVGASLSWTAAAFPLAFIPLSVFCLVQARRGHIRSMILLYVWVNLLAIGAAVWLFEGVYSPAWVLFIWTVTVAGILLTPASSLWITGGVLAYFVLLWCLTKAHFYTPPLTFGLAGREFVNMSVLLIMLVSTVGLLTYLNMRSLRQALGNLRTEIAGRKRTEESLRQSEERFRGIFEHVNDIIYTVEADGTFSSISPSCERMLGWQPDEWTGHPFAQIVHPDDLPRMQELFQRVHAGRALPVFEVRILTKAGGYLASEIAATPIHRDHAIVILGVVRDITERRQAEAARQVNELRLQLAIRCGHLGVWDLDLIDHTAYRSLEHDRIFGYQSLLPQWTLEMFLEHVVPEERIEVSRLFNQAVANQSDWNFECRIRRIDGEVRWILANGSHQRDPTGLTRRMIGIVQDITERKQAEDQIRQLNEELDAKVKQRTQQLLQAQDELLRKEKLAVLGQVAGSVGHELRNPLGVMSNAVYFLQTVLTGADDSVKEYLNIIRSEIADSERIVSDLLDSVRTKPPQPETVGVVEMIEQTLGKLTLPSSVTVTLDIPEKLAPLRVDAMQIQQVLRNLIGNALEAMPQGGTLELGATENRPAGSVAISVRDSGTGMTPEVLAKLFQPLFTTKARGIGLGLVVVKNLVQANGGSVQVASVAGKGSLFTVTLPSDSAGPAATAEGAVHA